MLPASMDPSKKDAADFSLKSFGIELAVYTVFVVAYFLLVLHFLGPWFKDLFDHDRPGYAAAGLAVVLAQAAALEILTTALLRFIRHKTQ